MTSRSAFRVRADLTRSTCQANFRRMQNGRTAPAELLELSQRLPVTHTFSEIWASNIFPDVEEERAHVAGLYARALCSGATPLEGDRVSVVVGLEEYVFAYHGIHDDYYRRGVGSGPIGAFISREYERSLVNAVNDVNATWRDLQLKDREGDRVLDDWFLAADDARELSAIEAAVEYEGDYWRYWGDPGKDDFRIDVHWERLFEFHFWGRVPADHLIALVWPAQMLRGQEPSGDQLYPIAFAAYKRVRRMFPRTKLRVYKLPDDSDDNVKLEFAKKSREVAAELALNP